MRTFDQTPRGAHTTLSSSRARPAATTAASAEYASNSASSAPSCFAHDFSTIAVYPQGHAQIDQRHAVRPQLSGALPGTIQRQTPPTAPAPVAQPRCQTPEHPIVESSGSDRFKIVDEQLPCYACPNS